MSRRIRETCGRRTPCEECILNLTDGIFKTSFCLFFPRIPRVLRLTQLGFQAKANRFTDLRLIPICDFQNKPFTSLEHWKFLVRYWIFVFVFSVVLFPSSITDDGSKKWEVLEVENWRVFYGLQPDYKTVFPVSTQRMA